MTRKIYIILLFLISFTLSCFAQSENWASWSTFKLSHDFSERLNADVIGEFRTKEGWKEMDRWGLALNVEYRLLSFMRVEAGYEMHHRNRGLDGWKFRQRYMVGATVSANWYLFNFSLRERFQQTFDHGKVETNLRSRAKVAFKPQQSIFSPYFSLELYQQIGHQSFWKVDRLRYRPGIDISLPKGWGLDLFYCYQHESGKGKNIIGIDCSFSF